MFQKIFTPFFVGQIVLEQAAEVSKKHLEVAREKANDYKVKAEEYKNVQVVAKAEQFAKEKFAKLRSCSEPFEKACLNVTGFLGETADIKTQLKTTDLNS